jgi:hypothetical protein
LKNPRAYKEAIVKKYRIIDILFLGSKIKMIALSINAIAQQMPILDG